MKYRLLCILLILLVLVGCNKTSSEVLTEESPYEEGKIISEENAAKIMHEIAPKPVRTGEEKDASEFVAPDNENIRFVGLQSYQLVDGGAYLGGSQITYYDFEKKSSEIVCEKADCGHNDDLCPAWIGESSDYAFSQNSFYVLQRNNQNSDWVFRLQKREQTASSWETLWEYPVKAGVALVGKAMLGGDWAVLTIDGYHPDGSSTTEILAVNLNDGTEKVIIPETPIGLNAAHEQGNVRKLSVSLWGVSQGYCVISSSMLPEDFPTLDEHLASTGPLADDQAISAATDKYIAQIDTDAITEYACYDLSSGERAIISSGPTAEVSGVCDSTSIYQGKFYFFKDGAIRAYDLKESQEEEILKAGYIGRITVVDGQIFYVLTAGNICELDSYSLVDGIVTKFTNENNTDVIVFTVYQENEDMFAGNYKGVECWISKADYYAENFSAAQPILGS